MKIVLRALQAAVAAGFALALTGVIGIAVAYLYLAPKLPSIESLKDVQLQVPLRVYTRDGVLLGEFGEKRRTPLTLDQVPNTMVNAFLAAEDDRFYEHPGVDYQGIVRAAVQLALTGEKRQGGSTITMQVARNFFLSREKTFLRKINEIFLALKIERELTKQEILELYLNKIYLGNRAYGVGAAAEVYYGVPVTQLTLAQTAMIAGLPKAPSRYNPLADRARATLRRNYVLGRMHELNFIDDGQYQAALAQPDDARLHALSVGADAHYVAEMVRADMVQRYGEAAYSGGYKVYTTISSTAQAAAVDALRDSLLEYDRRHGYRGPEAHIPWDGRTHEAAWDERLSRLPPVGGLRAGLVVAVDGQTAQIYLGNRQSVVLPWSALQWVHPRRRHGAKPRAADILTPGDIIRLQRQSDGDWLLAEVPAVEGAIISISPRDGAIAALVGGFDFARSKFNRAIQAQRQPGSSLKPFIYSAALDKGFTAASIFNDAPVVVNDPSLETTWRPENYSGHFYGPTRLREALVHSRNLVSIRVLQAVGVGYAIDHLKAFGLPAGRLPHDLSLALGSATLTPLEMVRAYAVFANGGYRVDPFLIQRIEDENGKTLYQAEPRIVCSDCAAAKPVPGNLPHPAKPAAVPDDAPMLAIPSASGSALSTTPPDGSQPPLAPRVISAQNAYLMYTMMRDVIRHGTGRRALRLGRHDIAGKTGTTNDQRDAWFCGFNTEHVAVAWVGFDDTQSLGERETGAHAALPVWLRYMQKVLAGTHEAPPEQPAGLVTARIDPKTGLLARADNPRGIFELFRAGHLPDRNPEPASVKAAHAAGPPAPALQPPEVSGQLF